MTFRELLLICTCNMPQSFTSWIYYAKSPLDICNGRVFATNMTGSTSLGGVEGTAISNLVVHMTNCTLQFNHNYIMTMEVGEGDRSVLKLGDLSMLPFIGGPRFPIFVTWIQSHKRM